MFKIHSEVKNGGIWDQKKDELIPFVDGIIVTADSELAEKCKARGYTVTEEVSKFDSMTLDELREYAFKNNINIGNSKTESAIIKRIVESGK